jgi:hypothetical protein
MPFEWRQYLAFLLYSHFTVAITSLINILSNLSVINSTVTVDFTKVSVEEGVVCVNSFGRSAQTPMR